MTALAVEGHRLGRADGRNIAGKRQVQRVEAVAIRLAQLVCHTGHRAAVIHIVYPNVGSSVNAHDAGAFRQGVIGPPEVFSHSIFAVDIICLSFGIVTAVKGLALLDILLGEAVLFRILLARRFQAGQVLLAGRPILVAHIGTVEDCLRAVLLDAVQKIQLGLGVARGPLRVLEDLVQNGVVLGLHPLVQILGRKIGVLDKEMAHPLFVVIVVPDLKFLLHDLRDGMGFPIQIDLPFLRAAGRGGAAKAGQR